jgi:hypothetical protein
MYLQYSLDNMTHIGNRSTAALSIKYIRNFKINEVKNIIYLLT